MFFPDPPATARVFPRKSDWVPRVPGSELQACWLVDETATAYESAMAVSGPKACAVPVMLANTSKATRAEGLAPGEGIQVRPETGRL